MFFKFNEARQFKNKTLKKNQILCTEIEILL